MINLVKVHGPRRVGSNYFEWLLSQNIDNLIILKDMDYWKHGIIKQEKFNQERYDKLTEKDFILSKNLTDLPSYNNIDPYNVERCVKKFFVIKNPYSWYLSICRFKNIEPFPLTNDKLEQLFIWCYLIRQSQSYKGCIHMVRYESLIKNPKDELFWANYFITGKQKEIYPIIDTDLDNYSNKKWKKEYYINQEYMKEFSQEDIKRIKEFVDFDYD